MYYPDFYLTKEDCYIEIKGYKDNKAEAKHSQFKHNLKVLQKEDLTSIFDFVVNKYGEDFVKLYDKDV